MRGPQIFVHAVGLAREFLAPLQAAHIERLSVYSSLATGSNLMVASALGDGWRSRLVEKKKQNAAQLATTDLDISSEVRARLDAVAVPIRAQVETQVRSGVAAHSARGLVAPKEMALANAAKHNFKNNKPFEETCLPR